MEGETSTLELHASDDDELRGGPKRTVQHRIVNDSASEKLWLTWTLSPPQSVATFTKQARGHGAQALSTDTDEGGGSEALSPTEALEQLALFEPGKIALAQDAQVMEALHAVAERGMCEEARESARGALFVLCDEQPDRPDEGADRQHVMLSYQWNAQAMIVRIRRNVGKQITTSMHRWTIRSVQPPRYAASEPIMIPMIK